MRIRIDSSIDRVYGGEDNALKEGNLTECRTMTALSVDLSAVKESVLIVRLASAAQPQKVKFSFDYRPFGQEHNQHQDYDVVLSDEPHPIVQKAFVLSVYYEAMREILPEARLRTELFDATDGQTLSKLRSFVVGQSPNVASNLFLEL
jgi:hypothetical protein